MREPLFELEGLGHAYGSVVALHDVDLVVPRGRIGLVGANGAGKTTLIRILLGNLRPTRGRVRVLGFDVGTEALEVRARVGYMPEGDALPPDLTAADFLVYAARLGGLPARAARRRASDVLTLVGLDEERFRPMGGFSTGMKQRAKLAQAIVHDPDFVLLDEPTAGLDPTGRDELLDLIGRLQGFGIDVLVSSHVLGDIERTCDWVVVLEGGRVLRSGPIAGLVDAEVVVVEPLADHDRLVEALAGAGATATREGPLVVVEADDDPFDLVRDVLADTGIGIRSLGPRRTRLEDVFLAGGDR
ncbi:MAG TPA: ABC transporter ATP-binding protein [Actinobacteria bacterium]|nr:ABC transporter ATP-binding protein [Actinomycetota bacterium]